MCKMQTAFTLAAFSLACAASASAQSFNLSWYTIDSGGAGSPIPSIGGDYEVSGTIGQPDAGSFSTSMSGGGFEVVGGFWTVSASAPPPCPGEPGDANCDGAIDFFDIDPFLLALFNNPLYLTTYCGGSNCAADVDGAGSVDFFDIDPFSDCLFGTCP